MSVAEEVSIKLRGITVQEASHVLFEAIKKDPELYRAYQANIAMAFKDEVARSAIKDDIDGETAKEYALTPSDVHRIANTAAENFLNLLIK